MAVATEGFISISVKKADDFYVGQVFYVLLACLSGDLMYLGVFCDDRRPVMVLTQGAPQPPVHQV